MLALYVWLKAWLTPEEGQDLIEYALIIGLMVVIAVLGLGFMGQSVSQLWSKIGAWMVNTVGKVTF